jgi:polysaccharide biosynthesis protein PslG
LLAFRQLRISLSVLALCGIFTACGSTFVHPNSEPIPSTYFGMTVLDSQHVNPRVNFGTTRTWDSFPMLDWAEINPSAGVYRFQDLDAFVQLNEARGAEVIYTFGRTPQWASSNPSAPGPYGPGQCAPPADLQNWDNYVTAIASHAGSRITYWELWNEPQNPDYYCGDMQTLLTMAQHAYHIIKSVNPAAQVLTPAVAASQGPAWLNAYLAKGGGQYADIIAFHGYCNNQAESISNVVSRYQKVIAAHGQASKPLWDTEADWAGDEYDGLEGSQNQAAFVAKYYLLQWSEGVSRFVWYAYDGGSWGGLWSPTTGAAPGVATYNIVQQWMVGASMTAACMPDSDGTWTCPLTRPGGYQALVLWNSGKTVIYRLPSQYTEIRDLAGNVQPLPPGKLQVGENPVLIETGKAF